MTTRTFDLRRRELLMAGAALVVAGSAARATVPAAGGATGKAGEFDFLSGSWRIRHRRRKAGGVWDEFEGEATCWSVLGGAASIEELRIPARGFSGMGIRLLDGSTGVWNDFWVSGKERVLSTPGMTGSFTDGVGTFTAEDEADGRRVIVRGVWDHITSTSCRWRQGASNDEGKTWDEDWFMEWTKV